MKYCLIGFALLCVISAQGATVTPLKDDKGKWGFVDENGEYVVSPRFTEITETPEGVFLVAEGGKIKDGVLEGEKWGVYSSEGKCVLPIEYDDIETPDNGVTRLLKGDKTGFADSNWNVIIPPQFSYAGSPSPQGYNWVNTGGKPDKTQPGKIMGGKYGIYDVTGKVILEPKYASIGYVTEERFHYDDKKIYAAKSDFSRLTLEAGNHIAYWPKPLQQQDGFRLTDNILAFGFSTQKELRMNGITSTDGNILINSGVFQKSAMPTDNYALVFTKKRIIGYYDTRTKQTTELPSVKSAFSFKNGLTVCVDTKNQWQFYNTDIKPVGEKFTWISPQYKDFYIVRNANGMSLLQLPDLSVMTEGKELIFPESLGYLAFKEKEGKWGHLNTDGSVALAPKYELMYSFNHNAGCVKSEKGWGLIDTDFNERISPIWRAVRFPTEDDFRYVWMDNEAKKSVCLDFQSGKRVFDKEFDNAFNFINRNGRNFAIVLIGEKYGQILDDGTMVVPAEMDNTKEASLALEYYLKSNIKKWDKIHSYRFKIYNSNSRNKEKLTNVLDENVWDY